MKEHAIVTKLRRPLENFTSNDLADLIEAYDELMLTVKACRGTQMDDAGIRNVQEMSAVVNAAIKWWWAQEKSDTEYHNAEHELSATVGKYCVRNKL
jgi:hypothetical protein